VSVAQRRIVGTPLPGVPANLSEDQRKLCLSEFMSLDRVQACRALGALLKFIQTNRVSEKEGRGELVSE
jgi:hypothetical protein